MKSYLDNISLSGTLLGGVVGEGIYIFYFVEKPGGIAYMHYSGESILLVGVYTIYLFRIYSNGIHPSSCFLRGCCALFSGMWRRDLSFGNELNKLSMRIVRRHFSREARVVLMPSAGILTFKY